MADARDIGFFNALWISDFLFRVHADALGSWSAHVLLRCWDCFNDFDVGPFDSLLCHGTSLTDKRMEAFVVIDERERGIAEEMWIYIAALISIIQPTIKHVLDSFWFSIFKSDGMWHCLEVAKAVVFLQIFLIYGYTKVFISQYVCWPYLHEIN